MVCYSIVKKSPLKIPVSTLLFALYATNMYYIHELCLVIDKKHRTSLLACITADGEVIQINKMQIKRYVFTCTNAQNSPSSVVTINDKTQQFIVMNASDLEYFLQFTRNSSETDHQQMCSCLWYSNFDLNYAFIHAVKTYSHAKVYCQGSRHHCLRKLVQLILYLKGDFMKNMLRI